MKELNRSTETTKVWYARSKNRYTVFMLQITSQVKMKLRKRLIARGRTEMKAEERGKKTERESRYAISLFFCIFWIDSVLFIKISLWFIAIYRILSRQYADEVASMSRTTFDPTVMIETMIKIIMHNNGNGNGWL